MIDFLCLSFRRPSAAEIDSRSCRTRPIGAKNGQKTLCYASALYVVYTSHYTIAQVYASRRCTGIVGERRTISSARNIMMSRTRFCSSECEQCCRSGDRKKKNRCLSTMLLCPLAMSIFNGCAITCSRIAAPVAARENYRFDLPCHFACLHNSNSNTSVPNIVPIGYIKVFVFTPASTKIDPGCCRAETRTKSPAFSGCASLLPYVHNIIMQCKALQKRREEKRQTDKDTCYCCRVAEETYSKRWSVICRNYTLHARVVIFGGMVSRDGMGWDGMRWLALRRARRRCSRCIYIPMLNVYPRVAMRHIKPLPN